MKVLRWVEDANTYPSMLLFLHVGNSAMTLHYKLFRYAQHTPYYASGRNFIFELCNPRKSVAVSVLSDLSCFLRHRSEQ